MSVPLQTRELAYCILCHKYKENSPALQDVYGIDLLKKQNQGRTITVFEETNSYNGVETESLEDKDLPLRSDPLKKYLYPFTVFSALKYAVKTEMKAHKRFLDLLNRIPSEMLHKIVMPSQMNISQVENCHCGISPTKWS